MLPCRECSYRESIAGNCHIKCMFAWAKADKDVQGKAPTLQARPGAQWFHFPLNYDPVWGPDECPAQSKECDPDMTRKESPWEGLASLLF